MDLVDLHCHILPNVDDGPATLDETVEILETAFASGTRAIAATPHMFLDLFGNRDAGRMRRHFEETQERLAELSNRQGLEFLSQMQLFLGAENYLSPAFLTALKQGQVLSLGGSRYLLVEFPTMLPGRQFMPAVEIILANGFVPVLAHIERYRACLEDARLIEACLEAGCLTQINASSVSRGIWGRERRRVWNWLKQDLISVIASDGHDSHHRPPVLAQAREKLCKSFPQEKIEAWFTANPRWILSAPAPERA